MSTVIFILSFRSLTKGSHYFFDPKHNKDSRLAEAGDFGPHSQRYQELAKLLIALAAGAIAFFINLFANDKPPTPAFVTRAEGVVPIVVGFFASSILSTRRRQTGSLLPASCSVLYLLTLSSSASCGASLRRPPRADRIMMNANGGPRGNPC